MIWLISLFFSRPQKTLQAVKSAKVTLGIAPLPRGPGYKGAARRALNKCLALLAELAKQAAAEAKKAADADFDGEKKAVKFYLTGENSFIVIATLQIHPSCSVRRAKEMLCQHSTMVGSDPSKIVFCVNTQVLTDDQMGMEGRVDVEFKLTGGGKKRSGKL